MNTQEKMNQVIKIANEEFGKCCKLKHFII